MKENKNNKQTEESKNLPENADKEEVSAEKYGENPDKPKNKRKPLSKAERKEILSGALGGLSGGVEFSFALLFILMGALSPLSIALIIIGVVVLIITAIHLGILFYKDKHEIPSLRFSLIWFIISMSVIIGFFVFIELS